MQFYNSNKDSFYYSYLVAEMAWNKTRVVLVGLRYLIKYLSN